MRPYGLGIGFNMIRSLATQAQRDAAAYAALLDAEGGTDITANGQLANLIAFATALYALAGRVDFWPLRSTQNMGTGTTAYSFQGQVGTLTNSPTWHANGLVLSGSAYLSVAHLSPGAAARTYFVIANVTNLGGASYSPLVSFGPQSVGGLSEMTLIEQSSLPFLRHHTWGGNSVTADGLTVGGDYGNFRGWGFTYETNPRCRLFKNGTQLAETSTALSTGAGGDHAFGRTGDGRQMAGTLSFGLAQLVVIDVAALYAAYKANLGSGLSLP